MSKLTKFGNQQLFYALFSLAMLLNVSTAPPNPSERISDKSANIYKMSLVFNKMAKDFLHYGKGMEPLLQQVMRDYLISASEERKQKEEIVNGIGKSFHEKIGIAMSIVAESSKLDRESRYGIGKIIQETEFAEIQIALKKAAEIKNFGAALKQAEELVQSLAKHHEALGDTVQLNEEMAGLQSEMGALQLRINMLHSRITILDDISKRRMQIISKTMEAKQDIEDARNLNKLKDNEQKMLQQLKERRERNQRKFNVANQSLALIKVTGKLLTTFQGIKFDLAAETGETQEHVKTHGKAIEILMKNLSQAGIKPSKYGVETKIRTKIGATIKLPTLEKDVVKNVKDVTEKLKRIDGYKPSDAQQSAADELISKYLQECRL